MNREKSDKIPSMQVSFIDAICTQLYEVIDSDFIWSFIIVSASNVFVSLLFHIY